jgi:hypothetical protein
MPHARNNDIWLYSDKQRNPLDVMRSAVFVLRLKMPALPNVKRGLSERQFNLMICLAGDLRGVSRIRIGQSRREPRDLFDVGI